MSLINKMLKDLETRKNVSSRSAPKPPIFDDLRPTMGMGAGARRRRMLTVVVAFALIAGGVYAWQQGLLDTAYRQLTQRSSDSAPTKVGSVAPQPAPVETPAPAPTTAESASAAETAPQIPAEPAVPPVADAAKEPAEPAVATGPTALLPVPMGGPTPVAPATTKSAAGPKAAGPRKDGDVAGETKSRARPAEKQTNLLGPDEESGSFEKKDRPQTIEEMAEGAYREGVRFMQQGRPTQADQALRTALTHDPKHLAARELLAGLQLEQGRTLEARKILEQGLVQVPEHLPFAQLLARLYVDQGAEPNAVAVLEKVRAQGADQPEYLAFLATLYQRAGRYADAVQAYRQALGIRPQEGRWWLGLGISLEAQKNLPAASEAYQRAKTAILDPKLARYAEQRLGALKNTK
jgi:MSHA biogenesis protein MshN